jgi:dimethylargininase
MLTAIVKTPAPSLVDTCELTFLERVPIDFERALAQHADYCRALERAGAQVVILEASPDLADSVFVEDTTIILHGLAVITRPGAPSRLPETALMEPVIGRYRRLEHIHAPGTVDGGDALLIGRTLLIGVSTRTNAEGIRQLEQIAQPLGYAVIPVPVLGSLHLKTACAPLDANTVLLNPDWIDSEPFKDFERIPVPADEPFGANALPISGGLIVNEAFPRTLDLIVKHSESSGVPLIPVNISEYNKAEAGLTCLSLLVEE